MPVAEWFQARDADEQTFTLRQRAIPGSVEVLINGLDELADIFSVHNKDVTVLTKPSKTDVVTIRYGGRVGHIYEGTITRLSLAVD
jgi:nitrous oxide reductase